MFQIIRARMPKLLLVFLLFITVHLFITVVFGIGNIFWRVAWIGRGTDMFNIFAYLVYIVGDICLYKYMIFPRSKELEKSYASLVERHKELASRGIDVPAPIRLMNPKLEKVLFPLIIASLTSLLISSIVEVM